MAKTIVFNEKTEKFLKKNKIKTTFVKNLKEYCKRWNKPIEEKVRELAYESPSSVIILAFTWIRTPEKVDYWDKMHIRAKRWEKQGYV